MSKPVNQARVGTISPGRTSTWMADWRHWQQSLQECHTRMGQWLEGEQWRELGLELALRETLIQRDLPVFLATLPNNRNRSQESTREEVSCFLQEILNTTREFQTRLDGLQSELAEKIHAARKGRKTLHLYKLALPAKPRFFDRRG